MTSEPASSVGRLLIFGDSIANGLGVRELRYAQLIASAYELELIDLTHTGATILDSLGLIAEDLPSADIAIIAHGITEPIFRPTPAVLRFLPKRWRRRGWMDPRPYYSRRMRKRVLERIESAVRWRVKATLVRMPKHRYQLVHERTYVDRVIELTERLTIQRTIPIVIGPPDIDDRYFPGSSASQRSYCDALERNGLDVVHIAQHLDRWQDYFLDHFHPNESGHRKIAYALGAHVEDALRQVHSHGGESGEPAR